MGERTTTILDFLLGDEATSVAYGWYSLGFYFSNGPRLVVHTEVHHTLAGKTDVWTSGVLPACAGLLTVLGNAHGRPANPVIRVSSEERDDLVIEFARGDVLRVSGTSVDSYAIHTKDRIIVA